MSSRRMKRRTQNDGGYSNLLSFLHVPSVSFLRLLLVHLALSSSVYALGVFEFTSANPSVPSGSCATTLVSYWPYSSSPSSAFPNSINNTIISSFNSTTFGDILRAAELQSWLSIPPSGDRAGAIVFVDNSWQSIYVIDTIRRLQNENASAILITTSYCTTSCDKASSRSLLFLH